MTAQAKPDHTNTRREYVTGYCMVAKFYAEPTVIVSVIGPKGGTKSTEVFSIDEKG